ncbi:hypothetical protein LT493_19675 [Streptomyces tricolor]|nr:hypothetical protein [Streptomyces tricolor]
MRRDSERDVLQRPPSPGRHRLLGRVVSAPQAAEPGPGAARRRVQRGASSSPRSTSTPTRC